MEYFVALLFVRCSGLESLAGAGREESPGIPGELPLGALALHRRAKSANHAGIGLPQDHSG